MKLKIGIFDSGIGGFTILKSLLKTRHDVEVYYLADTQRSPYGNKKFQEIRSIAKEICRFFGDKNLDALLIACNTTNACALDILEKNLRIPCFDLINSVSEIVNKPIIGVLATRATVSSSYYKNAISSKNTNIKIFQQECPEFVPEIEKNLLNINKLNYLSELYLRPLIKENIQELALRNGPRFKAPKDNTLLHMTYEIFIKNIYLPDYLSIGGSSKSHFRFIAS